MHKEHDYNSKGNVKLYELVYCRFDAEFYESYVTGLSFRFGTVLELNRGALQYCLKHSQERTLADTAILQNSEYFEAKRYGSDMSLISEEMAPILMHRAAREIFELSSSSEEAMGMWQDRHYMEKLQVFDPTDKRLVVEEYTRALNWSVHYYTKGVASWAYSYPYLYAPFAADMKKLKMVTSKTGACFTKDLK